MSDELAIHYREQLGFTNTSTDNAIPTSPAHYGVQIGDNEVVIEGEEESIYEDIPTTVVEPVGIGRGGSMLDSPADRVPAYAVVTDHSVDDQALGNGRSFLYKSGVSVGHTDASILDESQHRSFVPAPMPRPARLAESFLSDVSFATNGASRNASVIAASPLVLKHHGHGQHRQQTHTPSMRASSEHSVSGQVDEPVFYASRQTVSYERSVAVNESTHAPSTIPEDGTAVPSLATASVRSSIPDSERYPGDVAPGREGAPARALSFLNQSDVSAQPGASFFDMPQPGAPSAHLSRQRNLLEDDGLLTAEVDAAVNNVMKGKNARLEASRVLNVAPSQNRYNATALADVTSGAPQRKLKVVSKQLHPEWVRQQQNRPSLDRFMTKEFGCEKTVWNAERPYIPANHIGLTTQLQPTVLAVSEPALYNMRSSDLVAV